MAIRIIRKGVASVSNDHNLLINRSIADQHPISSISGLQSELDSKAAGSQDVINKLLDRISTLEGLEDCIDDDYVISYEYDDNNVLVGQNIVSSNNNKNVSFTYDGENIVKEVVTSIDKVITRVYQYDTNGNITSIAVVTV